MKIHAIKFAVNMNLRFCDKFYFNLPLVNIRSKLKYIIAPPIFKRQNIFIGLLPGNKQKPDNDNFGKKKTQLTFFG